MFRDDYASELEYLHALAGEVARDHPHDAPLLGREASPAGARLLQCAAFAFAKLRQRLDDDLPEVIHPVLESLAPALLRPLPGATIVELRPEASLKASLTLPAGTTFGSVPVEGAPCTFRSTVDIDVHPWRLERVSLSEDRRELRFVLAPLRGGKLDAAPGAPLRLFLAGPTSAALDLRRALLRDARLVSARGERGASVVLHDRAPPLTSKPPLSGASGERRELALARAYFAWPSFFTFVDVPNAERALALAKTGNVEISIALAEPLPRALAVADETFRLHCVPALNVRRLPEPIHAPLRNARCAVALPLAGLQVHAIGKVTLVHRDLTTRDAAPESAFFPPVVERDGRAPPLFAVERRASVLGPHPIVSLAFEGPELATVDAAKIEVEVIDGARAERLGVGDVSVPVPGSPALVSFANVTPITRAVPPAFDDERAWRWFRLLKSSFAELATREALAECLALANGPAWAAWPAAKPDARSFAPLVDVRVSASIAATTLRSSVDLIVRSEGFDGVGDVHLFGEVVLELLAAALPLDEAFSLTVHDTEGTLFFSAPPRAGTREAL
ncbi:MAG TPA: type VI secretion system baseplate subunit TssF [Polyangiaceae bacterium]